MDKNRREIAQKLHILDHAEKTGLRSGSLHAAFGDKGALFALALEDYAEIYR